ncbi:MAG TPA: hypothetical protein DHW17_07575 [Nitrospina sp.]|nr:hypothetical protein [Nitrospina sp.]
MSIKPEWGEVANCFVEGFQQTFPGYWKPETLNSFETELVKEYLEENEQISFMKGNYKLIDF